MQSMSQVGPAKKAWEDVQRVEIRQRGQWTEVPSEDVASDFPGRNRRGHHQSEKGGEVTSALHTKNHSPAQLLCISWYCSVVL